MSATGKFKKISFEVSNDADIKDILFYNELENKDDNNNVQIEDNIIPMMTPKTIISNRAHLSYVLLSYALINIIDVIKNIPNYNLLSLTADAITTTEEIKNIKISSKIGEWKRQDQDSIIINKTYNHFININDDTNYKSENSIKLTEDKQNYTKFNLYLEKLAQVKRQDF